MTLQPTALSTEEKGLKKIVSFDDSFNNSETKGDIENRKLEKTSLAFTPHKCSASISWDIWSLGLVMGQLILGQSMIYLPNFENASDAHLKNLYHYDEETLQVRNELKFLKL